MTSEAVLGGVAALLALWMFMSSLEGLGYAVPVRPNVIVPMRWAGGAKVLIWVIVIGLAASIVLPAAFGAAIGFSWVHPLIALGIILPIWEILASRMYGDSFVVINGRESVVRPIIVAAVAKVFGDMDEDEDMLYSIDKRGEDWQLIPHEQEHLLVVDPTFKVDLRRRKAFEITLDGALKRIKPAGFNERSFWISFVAPLGFAAAYGLSAYYLLRPLTELPLRGTLGG